MKKLVIVLLLGFLVSWRYGTDLRAFFESYSGESKAGIRYASKSDDFDRRQLEESIEGLKAEQQRRAGELSSIEEKIRLAEGKLAQAKAEAEQAKCEASNERINAKIIVKQVECYKKWAGYSHCVALNEKEKGDTALLGSLVGVGIAIATGGAATPLVGAAAGGLAGREMGGSKKCGAAPRCELDPEVLEQEVLEEEGLSLRPNCFADEPTNPFPKTDTRGIDSKTPKLPLECERLIELVCTCERIEGCETFQESIDSDFDRLVEKGYSRIDIDKKMKEPCRRKVREIEILREQVGCGEEE